MSSLLSRVQQAIAKGKESSLSSVSSSQYEFMEPALPYTNNGTGWAVVMGFPFQSKLQGIVSDANAVDVAVIGLQTANMTSNTLTAGSGTGTTGNQNGQVYTGSGWSIGAGQGFTKVLVPPGFKIRGQLGGGSVMVVYCRTLEDAVMIL